jgi:phage terminase small subunit
MRMAARKKKAPKKDAMQKLFAQEYLIDLNAKQAAIRAGYSPKTAQAQGCRLLTNVKVQGWIAAAQAQRAKRTEITADRVLEELAKVGFSDLRRTMTDQGALLNPCEWDDKTAHAISSIEVVTRPTGEKDEQDLPIIEHVHKIKTWDKVSALEKMGKHLGMFPTKIDANITGEVIFNTYYAPKPKEIK